MEKGPQYIGQYGSVHNILVQYGKGSIIHYFNVDCCPQYISSIRTRVQIAVHNISVQYGTASTIH